MAVLSEVSCLEEQTTNNYNQAVQSRPVSAVYLDNTDTEICHDTPSEIHMKIHGEIMGFNSFICNSHSIIVSFGIKP